MTLPEQDSARKDFRNLPVDYLFKTFLFCGKREEKAEITLTEIFVSERNNSIHPAVREMAGSCQLVAENYAMCQAPRIAPIAA
jgi:hypothetical protein